MTERSERGQKNPAAGEIVIVILEAGIVNGVAGIAILTDITILKEIEVVIIVVVVVDH
jgi:hypothetical protein